MNYVIFDLEFNQAYNFARDDKNRSNKTEPRCPFEIIQIGAVKLDEGLHIISSLDRLVKPEIYTSLNPYVKEMTGISMSSLNSANTFYEVYNEFIEFMSDGRNILCVWGTGDIKELYRNIEYHGLDISPIPREYINIQFYASKYLNSPRGISIGLGNAVELLNVPLKDGFHDAFNDACYTAEVFKKILNENIKPKSYSPDKFCSLKRPKIIKNKIDERNLVKQFEKMYNRNMTDEEKSIIKLAYMMGNTNQFQIEVSDKSRD